MSMRVVGIGVLLVILVLSLVDLAHGQQHGYHGAATHGKAATYAHKHVHAPYQKKASPYAIMPGTQWIRDREYYSFWDTNNDGHHQVELPSSNPPW